MKLTEQDLNILKSNAITAYTAIPAHARLPGSNRELSEDERRSYAYLEASLNTLNRLSNGALSLFVEQLNLRTVVTTNGHDVLDEATDAVSSVRANRV